jgi:hypothetical protein
MERSLRKALEDGTALCLACGRAKKLHDYNNNKCDNYATSFSFRCKEEQDLQNVTVALQMIEDLKELKL